MSRLGPFSENTIVVGDCLKIMPQMPRGCVDLIFADPPYGIGKADWDEWVQPKAWLVQCQRLVKDGGSIYVSCPRQRLVETYATMDLIGLQENRIIINHWRNGGIQRQGVWASMYEPILYFSKGEPETFNDPPLWKDAWDVWVVARPQTNFIHDKRIHPTQKPLRTLEKIIEASSNRNDLIFDPFMGSGTTAVVADRLGRKFFGCDISEEYVKMALERLGQDRAARQLQLL